MNGSVRRLTVGLFLAAATAVAVPAAADAQVSRNVWDAVPGRTPAAMGSARADITPERFRAFTLDNARLRAGLATAPRARAGASNSLVLSVPAPDGTFQRFAVQQTSIMEAKLAARHPGIKTYAGHGIDDPASTIVADTSQLGFHASIRSPAGAWYVDPYYHLNNNIYASYYGSDLLENPHGTFVERGPLGESDSPGFGAAAAAGPEVKLRTYRLALVTDPTYSTYFGGPANVTAAKVTLMNRVNQIYESESGIRMILVGDNDKLNLNTAADMTLPNGPCGAAACYTQGQATSCAGATLTRNRIVIGQIIGAGNYDVGHIALGNPGGGVANLGVIGGNNKAGGCTGLSTPVGDYFAVDYVSHEIGHQFAGNHTFNGTQSNCSGGNRNAGTSVEPGSGSSIMAYAGICQQDNLQPHSDPYWSQRSYDEITALVTGTRPAINEVQTVSLRDFGAGDSLRLSLFDKQTAPITSGGNYTLAGIQQEIQGPSEVQTVGLTGYDTNGDSYRLSFGGVNSHPIVRGQNNTAAGVANAVLGGNEQQQVTLAGFNGTTQSFQIQINGVNSVVLGQGGLAVSNANVQTAVNGIAGFAGGVTSAGAGNTGFTLTFAGASAGVDAPAVSIVNCTGACTATVRELAKGGAALSTWPAGATLAVGTVADSGYTLTISGNAQGTDFAPFSVADAVGATGAVTETVKGAPGLLPPGATGTVAAFGGTGNLTADGFQVTFANGLALTDIAALGLEVTGGGGFVGETARGGAVQNQGFVVTDTANRAPDVAVAGASFTIPPRTPFALTGSATDPDGDVLTYMWEQNDRGAAAGTALVNNVKTAGPLFRQFGKAADVSATDALLYHSPGLNATTTNPTRVFPDMDQILSGNTNAATGACPAAPPAPQALPAVTRECYSEFLPTADWVGFLSDRTLNFRLTARDGKMGGGGIGFAATQVTVAQFAGPFRVTSQAVSQVIYGTTAQTVTWDVAGTDVSPIDVANVKISVITDTGASHVITESTPNDGSFTGAWPNVALTKARVKVEAVGNVFFDVSDVDLTSFVAPTSGAGGTVAATLSLTLGAPAAFGAFTPGVTRDYDAGSTANVISTAGDAALSVADPSATAPGHLVNGTFVMPSALTARAGTTGAFSTLSGAPATLKTYDAPISNDAVTLGFRQHVGSTDALRTGTYAKTLTFTLSTTTP